MWSRFIVTQSFVSLDQWYCVAHFCFIWLSEWTLREGCSTASEYDPLPVITQLRASGATEGTLAANGSIVPRLNTDVPGVVCFQTRPAGTSKQRWRRVSSGTASGNGRSLMTNCSVTLYGVVGTMFWRSILPPSSGYKMEATARGVITWTFDARCATVRPPEEGAERPHVWSEWRYSGHDDAAQRVLCRGIHRQGCQCDVCLSVHRRHRLRLLPLRPEDFSDGFLFNKSQETVRWNLVLLKAWVSNPRPARLNYVTCGHVCILHTYVYYKNYTIMLAVMYTTYFYTCGLQTSP